MGYWLLVIGLLVNGLLVIGLLAISYWVIGLLVIGLLVIGYWVIWLLRLRSVRVFDILGSWFLLLGSINTGFDKKSYSKSPPTLIPIFLLFRGFFPVI